MNMTHHYGLNSHQHKRENLNDNLTSKKIVTLIMYIIFIRAPKSMESWLHYDLNLDLRIRVFDHLVPECVFHMLGKVG